MKIIEPHLSTGDVDADLQRDSTLEKIRDSCFLILEAIQYPNLQDYDDENTYLNAVNSLVKQFVDKARGSYDFSGHDGYISILQHCDNLTKSFNEPKYDES